MEFKQMLRLIIISCLSLVVIACKPWADFSFSPTSVVAGVEATFDASSTVVTGDNSAAAVYNWDFGDASAATNGKVVKHTFANAGTYNVKLTVKNVKGEIGTVTKAVVVEPAVAATASIQVQVQGSDGVPLNNAKVDVGSITAQTTDLGAATLADVAPGVDRVVTVTKTGYITQSLRVSAIAGATARAFAILQPIKELRNIPQAQVAQTIVAQSLGASVTLTANALVAPDNTVATGEIRMELTPWDITNSNLSAMLGNGVARTASGEIVNLISAGMMTVDFYDAQNRHLQLAAGKTADIRMDLPYASINNQALSVGSSIPLWHFDVAQGRWVEEGVGSVVASATSPVGLAVKATVSHFSTWNWGYEWDQNGDATVSCLDGASAPLPCELTITAILADGSSVVINTTIAAGVALLRDFPDNAVTLHWRANIGGGLAEATSVLGANVVLTGKPVRTGNFVQCSLPDATKVACSVQQTVNGSVKEVEIPAEGGWVQTFADVPIASSITWSAQSGIIQTAANQYFRYEGATSSGTFGAVNIALTTEIQQPEKTVQVQCAAATIDSLLLIDYCEIDLYEQNNEASALNASVTIRAGSIATFIVPPTATVVTFGVRAALLGGLGFGRGSFTAIAEELVNNELINIEIRGGAP